MGLFYIFLIFLLFAIILQSVKQFGEGDKGKDGERKVAKFLSKKKPPKRFVFNDSIFGNRDSSVQIDHIVIQRNGVFVIETKNYSGVIIGRDEEVNWTQVMEFGKKTYSFYSPVRQNESHARFLTSILPKGVPIYPIVVFIQNNAEYVKSRYVYNFYELNKALNKPHTHISDDQMRRCETNIAAALANSTATLETHIAYVERCKENNLIEP